MKRSAWVPATIALLLGAAAPAETPQGKGGFPLPPLKDRSVLGAGIQRTMTLLATSSPDHRHKVRILFYGQSITEQDWWKRVADDLRKRFPNADLEIENRAIGGFASQWLVRSAEHDLYPFYPDLLIFHVYGANNTYEEIIRNVRSRTTAEVLMQKDHVTAWPPEKPDEKADKGMWWDHMMNNVFLPQYAQKYGCALLDVRSPWLEYLKTNQLEPKDLLKDGVHLNDHGNYLLSELVKRYLVYRPDLPARGWSDMVRTLEVGKDVAWKGGKLVVEFEGNRVDALADPVGARMPSQVRIDGKKPSEFPGCYRITRPSPGPWSPLFIKRIDHDQPLVLEDWTLKVTSVSDDGKQFKFEVKGSVTGADGSGDNTQPFVSKSGRVRIAPDDWFAPGKARIPVGYESKWQVLPMFLDSYTAPDFKDPSYEHPITLAQGLPNGKHTLELSGETRIRAIRVYRPPVR
jgi:hypothetical protein